MTNEIEVETNKGYLITSRNLVLKTLKRMPKGWHTCPKIKNKGDELFNNIMPRTQYKYNGRQTSGGWGVFDFDDRVRRALKYWVKQGKIKSKKEGHITYYSKL